MPDADEKPESVLGNAILQALKFTDRDEPYYEEKIRVGNHEDVRPFFTAALQDRLPKFIIAFLATVLLAYLIAPQPRSFRLQFCGLLLDLLGAFILGVGLLRSEVGIERDSIATTEAATGLWAGYGRERHSDEFRHPLSVSSEARDTVDALGGITFLMIGFGFQALALLM